VKRLLATLAGLALAGCSTFALVGLQPGKSTEADVRRALGEPAKTFTLPDGTRQFAYPTGPGGMQTYMAYVSASGSLVRMEQVLVDTQFQRIVPGTTTAAEVERLIGPPWRKIDFPNKRQVAWDYVYQDTWDYTVDLAVMIDERGIVAETVHARRTRGDSGHN
jgi:hypothetical protein